MESVATAVVVRPFSRSEWETYRDVRLLALQTDPQQFSSSWGREATFGDDVWMDRASRCVGMFTFVADDKALETGSPDQLMSMKSNSRPLTCVGLAGVIPSTLLESPGTDKDGRPMCEVVSVWLSPSLRGKGFSKQLMQGVLDFATMQGYPVANISVKSTNLAALHLYRSIGFEERDMSDVTLTGDACACDVRLQRFLPAQQ